MFKSKRLIVAVVVLGFVIVALNLNNASAGDPFNPILKKLNKIIRILEENLLPVPCDPVPCDPVPCIDSPQVPKTGQTISFAPGDDGHLQKGVAWPNPRFTDNEDGTVTDNMTGLVWLKDANCFGTRSWADALSHINGLANGSCQLTDGSSAGDWRLANVKELQSLIHYGFYNPALPNTSGTGRWTSGDPFTNLQLYYWSSTTYKADSAHAWYVNMYSGYVGTYIKPYSYFVWPVRGGS